MAIWICGWSAYIQLCFQISFSMGNVLRNAFCPQLCPPQLRQCAQECLLKKCWVFVSVSIILISASLSSDKVRAQSKLLFLCVSVSTTINIHLSVDPACSVSVYKNIKQNMKIHATLIDTHGHLNLWLISLYSALLPDLFLNGKCAQECLLRKCWVLVSVSIILSSASLTSDKVTTQSKLLFPNVSVSTNINMYLFVNPECPVSL